MNFVLVFLVFMSNSSPLIASKNFTTRTACEITEGDAITAMFNDDTVTGFLIVDECREMGGKATKG